MKSNTQTPNRGGNNTMSARGVTDIQPCAAAQSGAERTNHILKDIKVVPTPNNTDEGAALSYPPMPNDKEAERMRMLEEDVYGEPDNETMNDNGEQSNTPQNADPWETNDLIDTPTLDGLSESAKGVIETYAKERDVPIDFVIAPIIAAIGAAAGSKIKIVDSFTNTLSVAVAVIAPSGSNKSQPGREIMRPLLDIDERLRKESEAEIKQYEEQKAAAKSKISFDGAQPKERCLILQNVTEEARKKTLADNPHGVLQYNDELVSFFDNMGKYTKSNEMGEIMAMLDGGSVSDTRKTGGSIYARNVYFSVFGTTQPKTALKYLATEDKYTLGFTPRFLIFQRLDVHRSRNGKGNVEMPLRFWADWVNRIYNLSGDWVLRPCEEASGIHKKFLNEIDYIANHTISDELKYVLSKLEIAVWKLSGIAHLLNEASEGRPFTAQITAKEMSWAVSICKYVYRKHMELLAQTDFASTEVKAADVVRLILRFKPDANQKEIAQLLGITHNNVRLIKHRTNQKKGV